MSKKRNGLIGIDAFSGAGGMSLGAAYAGISVVFAIEKDEHAASTYMANHPQTQMYIGDINDIKELSVDVGNSQSILFGGPPCQGFSTSNRRTKHLANPQNWLYKEFIRLLATWRPDWFVFENVCGITEMDSGNFVIMLISEMEALGYTCSSNKLNTVDFGIPQVRKRFFIIGSRHGMKITLEPNENAANITVRDALFDLPELPNGANFDILPYRTVAQSNYAASLRGELASCTGHIVSHNNTLVLKRYEYIKQGENWKSIPQELMATYSDQSRCHTGIYYRLHENKPSVVISNYRKNMLIHPRENRGLSVREAARLQSFPDTYVFKGSIGFQQQQVGNAVPPLLAKSVFDRIIENC